MSVFALHRKTTQRITTLLLALLVCGCAGWQPYEPRNYREEGPEMGLISGEKGEFVIYKK